MATQQLHRLSASSLAVLLECPRCFWLQVHENLRRPSGPFPSLPSGVDGVLKTYFDQYRKKGKLPPDVEKLLPGTPFPRQDVLDTWRNNRLGIRTKRPDLGIELTGALDDLLQEGAMVTPLDFKTRGYPLKDDTHKYYQHQLDLYAYLLEQNGYRTSGRGFLLFLWPEEVRDGGLMKFRMEAVEMFTSTQRAENLLTRAAQLLKEPMPERHAACAFCQFVDSRTALAD